MHSLHNRLCTCEDTQNLSRHSHLYNNKRHFHGARGIVCFYFTCAILSYCPIKHHKEPFWYFAKITRGESEADLFNKKCIGPNRCCQAKSSMSYIRWGGKQCRRIVRARLFPVWNPTSFWYWNLIRLKSGPRLPSLYVVKIIVILSLSRCQVK